MRRVLIPLPAVALVAASMTAEAAVRRKPVIPACPVFTDPAGDDGAADLGGQGEDPSLDIVGTKMTVSGGNLTVTLTMSEVGQPGTAEGAEYSGGFTLGGKAITLFGTESATKPVMETAFAMTGITVDGEYVQGTQEQVTITVDEAKKTVALTTALSSVSTAAEVKAAGTVKGLLSIVRGTYVVLLAPYDDASTTKTLALSGCKG